MNTRDYILLDRESIATAGTKTIDLKALDPISQMNIGIRLTNNSNTPTAHPIESIKQIQIIDGSYVILSLTGREALGLDYWCRKKVAQNILNYQTGEIAEVYVPINFGTKLWDTKYALDASRFKNPQLKITHDYSLGGSAPSSSSYLSVHLRMFDDKKVSPIGWLKSHELNSTALPTGTQYTVQMPADFPLRMMMLHSKGNGKQPWEQYNQIYLTENNDKKIPLNMRTTDLLKILNQHVERYSEKIRGTCDTSGETFYITPTFESVVNLVSQDAYTTAFRSYLPDGGVPKIYGEASGVFDGEVKGYNPLNTLGIPFGDPLDDTDWYNIQTLGDLKLKITGGSSPYASSTCEVVLQQALKY